MNKAMNDAKIDFSNKVQLLEEARLQLKKEFIGIDKAIDEVVNNVRAWYTMLNFQDRPVILPTF